MGQTSAQRYNARHDKIFAEAMAAKARVAKEKALKTPMTIARSVFKCPHCGDEVRLTFKELADVGYPLCPVAGCLHQMRDLVAVEIFGETLPVPFTSCKE